MNEPQSVQGYIDQTPSWPDGTPTPSVPMTRMQWRIWILATAGKFFEGLVVFMTGVALPLIVKEFGLSPTEKGIVGAAPLAGIMVGAITLGGLADIYGRRRMFVVEMLVFAIFLVGLAIAPGFGWLVFFLFGMGVALGCDYPTAHLVISESIPSRDRGKLVLGAFAFQAVGALVGTMIGYLILANIPELGAWRLMYAVVIAPAVLIVIARLFVTDSGQWLMSRGRRAEAERELQRLLEREPPYPKKVHLAEIDPDSALHSHDARRGRWRDLFNKKNRRATILASVPWFLQDLGTYGIGIFTPTILSHTIGHEITNAQTVAGVVARDIAGAKGAALVDTLLIAGILAAVLLADKAGRIRLQVLGFIGCAVGLALALLQTHAEEPLRMLLLFGGFMIFNFMTNLGPNAQTYLLAGEVFPTNIRGKGAGFAAAFAKIGAVLTAFVFPLVLDAAGTNFLLAGLIFTSLLGALVTWWFRIETKGVNLEEIGR
ncbi:MFS transporter [Reyranella sp.]|uniref:MFS transporter n=1 Tax=Reyranella sp. TaxID=1929291 RepID=UPI0025FDBB31|nr:MFS transporter [Reyranella sp.]